MALEYQLAAPKTELYERMVVIHSKDRDVSIFPSPSKYSINISKVTGVIYNNIKSVRLHNAIFPTVNNVTDEPYLLLNVDELSSDAFDGTNGASQRAVAIITLDRSYNTKFFNIKGTTCIAWPPSRSTLTNLTISVTNQFGEPFDFGQDSPGTINTDIQHSLMFIITQEKPIL